jgi:hypothetical protein
MLIGLPTIGSARPRMAILIVLVRWISALAIRFGAGIMP